MTEDVLLELSMVKELHPELGHRREPRRLLVHMAEEIRYPESVLTLGSLLYTDSQESDKSFAEFLSRHAANEWLLTTLIRLDGSSENKRAALANAYSAHPSAERLRWEAELRNEERLASTTADETCIRQIFAECKMEVWRGLAKNPATPVDLLEQLANVESIPSARAIRQLASENLAARKK